MLGLRSDPTKVWAEDPATGKRRDLSREEDHAFWAWAIVEVLRATGVRVEELLELSHHSLVQYRLPTTGELVPLLQIVPSKTDAERLLVISPELAEVLSTIISRTRGNAAAVPLVSAYDGRERLWSPPAPLLFQRRIGPENRPIAVGSVGTLLVDALAHTGLLDPVDGQPLRYTPHDFRRMFITDAILNGLPPHIAQVIAGHHDINVTLGYKAIYPEEAIQAHLAFLARRRALRPGEEYRAPYRRGVERVPRPLRTAQGFHRHLRPRVQHPVHPRTRLHPLPDALARPGTAARLVEIRDNLTPASPRPNAKAGSARSKDSTSASPAPTTRSPRSTAAPPATPPSTSVCPYPADNRANSAVGRDGPNCPPTGRPQPGLDQVQRIRVRGVLLPAR